MTARSHDPVFERIGDHAVIRRLGAGATGTVYACRDARRGHPVAIKVLARAIVDDARMLTRLSREGRAKASLKSPHVAQYFRMGEHEGHIYLVTELLEGESLAARQERSGHLSLVEAWRALRAAARGLKAAAEAQLRHRDVKPSNLFLVDGRVKLVDLGLAKRVDGAPKREGARSVRGTPSYMAPEIAQGTAGDHRSDMYSLGATVYALLAGRPPFVGSDLEVLRMHVKDPPPYLGALRPDTPPAMLALVARLLMKDPSFRPRHYDELLDLIDEARVEPSMIDDAPPLQAGSASFVEDSTEVFERDESASAAIPRPGTKRALPLPFDEAVAPALPDAPPDAPPPPVADVLQHTPAYPMPVRNPEPSIPTGIVGSLKQMGVLEVVQTMEMGRKTATVDVQPRAGERGVLAFAGGALVFASYGALTGVEAFYALVPMRDGLFRIHFGDAPAEKNIDAPTQYLLLEALRRIDDAGREEREG